MATAALLTVKPFRSIANKLGPVAGYSSDHTLVLAHTGNSMSGASASLQQVSKLKHSSQNLIMLHAGERAPVHAQDLFDVSMHPGDAFSVTSGDHKIIYKGDIKTGIIMANDRSATAESINILAVYLKNEKNCQVVVCLSQLGYKAPNGLNDQALAASSTHIDVIMGGHDSDFCIRPVVARNRNKEEVIINHAGENAMALRKIEIGFNNRGKKIQVGFPKSS